MSVVRRWARVAPSLVAATLLGSAATFAWLAGGTGEHATIEASPHPASTTTADLSLPPNHPPTQSGSPGGETALPPNHPPVGGGSLHGTMPAPSAEAPAPRVEDAGRLARGAKPHSPSSRDIPHPGGAEM